MGGTAGLNSPAETIIYFFVSDSTTTRTDDYILFRQVNQQAPELVARNLLHTGSRDFFRYFRRKTPLNAPAYVDTVPTSQLPMRHSVAWHGSPADTGASGRVDSLRGVELNFTVTNGKSGTDERTLSLSRTIRFPNAGLAVRRTCGDAPILGVGLAAAGLVIGGNPAVQLTWSPATDEQAGEKDVELYVIWRRVLGDPEWGTPYLSIPAGQASYIYQDVDVTSGTTYEYALAAQDCTPLASVLTQSAPVLVP
jgi:hypothetical protein